MKDVLKSIITVPGEQYVTTISIMQQQKLFAIRSRVESWDILLVISTVQVADRFGWTTFSAMKRKMTFQTVSTTAGAVTTVDTIAMSQSLVRQ